MTLRPSTHVVARRVGDELVVVHLKTNRIFSLNRTAARLWELVEAGLTRPEIKASLLGEFGADEATLDAEIDSTLAAFSAEALVTVE